jgi:ABC-type amino acid transport substrate-binding protein
MTIKMYPAFLFLLLFTFYSTNIFAQLDSIGVMDTLAAPLERNLKVGVFEQPPYVIKGENNTWDGISIRLWRAIADDLNLTSQFVEVPGEAGNEAIQNGQADVLLLGEVTAEADAEVYFSHIYHTAQQGIATSKSVDLGKIAKGFFSTRFWYTAGILSILLLLVGTVIYFVERGGNEDEFGGERSITQGIGSGFWWAGVTMTTIGYGDKAPTTFFGRAVALLWMLVAMAVTAVLTASLVSTVMDANGGRDINVPKDLRDMKVAAIENSDAAKYLREERITFKGSSNLQNLLEDVGKGKVDGVLHSVPVLRYTINNDQDLSLKVQAVNISPQYYALAFGFDSKLREPINHALLRVISTSLWQQQLDRFIPEKK